MWSSSHSSAARPCSRGRCGTAPPQHRRTSTARRTPPAPASRRHHRPRRRPPAESSARAAPRAMPRWSRAARTPPARCSMSLYIYVRGPTAFGTHRTTLLPPPISIPMARTARTRLLYCLGPWVPSGLPRVCATYYVAVCSRVTYTHLDAPRTRSARRNLKGGKHLTHACMRACSAATSRDHEEEIMPARRCCVLLALVSTIRPSVCASPKPLTEAVQTAIGEGKLLVHPNEGCTVLDAATSRMFEGSTSCSTTGSSACWPVLISIESGLHQSTSGNRAKGGGTSSGTRLNFHVVHQKQLAAGPSERQRDNLMCHVLTCWQWVKQSASPEESRHCSCPYG